MLRVWTLWNLSPSLLSTDTLACLHNCSCYLFIFYYFTMSSYTDDFAVTVVVLLSLIKECMDKPRFKSHHNLGSSIPWYFNLYLQYVVILYLYKILLLFNLLSDRVRRLHSGSWTSGLRKSPRNWLTTTQEEDDAGVQNLTVGEDLHQENTGAKTLSQDRITVHVTVQSLVHNFTIAPETVLMPALNIVLAPVQELASCQVQCQVCAQVQERASEKVEVPVLYHHTLPEAPVHVSHPPEYPPKIV